MSFDAIPLNIKQKRKDKGKKKERKKKNMNKKQTNKQFINQKQADLLSK